MTTFFNYAESLIDSSGSLDPEKDYRPVATAKLNDVLYMVHPSERLSKYDGDAIYWAGVPQPDQITTATNTGTLAGTYKYIATYIQVDARGNTHESVASVESASVSPSTQSVDLTLPNNFDFAGRTDDESYNKFKINRGYANGAQVGVNTINMTWTDPGASALTDNEKLQVGNIVYFLDRSTGDYVTRNVTAVGASSITIDGAAVDVNNNDPFSANLRLAIYRTVDSGNDFYLLAELPWNIEFNGVYNDDTADGSLGAQYLYPLDGQEHTIPPIAGYSLDSSSPSADSWIAIGTYKGRLLLGGANSLPNTIAYSVTNNPEYFPATNSFTVGDEDNSRITGIIGLERFFLVFKERSCYRVTGSLESNDISVETLSLNVGCVSHHTIKQISYGGRSRVIFLAEDGVFEIVEGQTPLEASRSIRWEFAQHERTNQKRSIAVVDPRHQKYWLFTPLGGVVAPTVTSSNVLVYDFDRDIPQWLKWGNMNMSCGAAIFKGGLYWLGSNNTYDARLYVKTEREDTYASFDHVSAIDSYVEFGSFNAGHPDVLAKFLRTRLVSLSHEGEEEFSLTVRPQLDYEKVGNGTFIPLSFTFDSTERRPIQNLTPFSGTALRYRFEHSTAGERPLITAIVTEISAPYAERLKEGRIKYDTST